MIKFFSVLLLALSLGGLGCAGQESSDVLDEALASAQPERQTILAGLRAKAKPTADDVEAISVFATASSKCEGGGGCYCCSTNDPPPPPPIPGDPPNSLTGGVQNSLGGPQTQRVCCVCANSGASCF